MDRTFTLFWIAVLFVHCVTSALANTSDQAALLQLKSHISFSSKNTLLEKNWSAASSVCSWMGVTCNSRHNRVAVLNISNMGLTGIIPPHLGNLTFLVNLDTSRNSFHGNLPEELSHLRRLKLLDLRLNNFSGPIPSAFGFLTDLRFLYLSNNQLSGEIPSSLSNISKLEEIDLHVNFLQASIPGKIGDLRHLTSLTLQSNQLKGPIPPSIFNMSSLQSIGLTSNHLSGNLPTHICSNLPKLKDLRLSDNELDGPIPSSLEKCSLLQILSLSVNKFTGTIPREIGNLTLLRNLHLGATNLTGSIPREIGNLHRLEVIGLNMCKLSGSIPSSIFNISTLQIFTCVENLLSGNVPSDMGDGLPNLEEIYLGINNLTGNIPSSISNASKLTILDLSNNNFTGPLPDSLGNLGSLEILNLAINYLMIGSSSSLFGFLTSLTNCRNLVELKISDNPLGGILPPSIGNLSTSLQIFTAYRCKFSSNIPDEIGNLSNVAWLSLYYNELTGVIPRTIEGLRSLQQLYLDNNKITGSLPNNICNLPKLGALGLRGNQISGPVPSCIGNITSLRNLYLSSNNFSFSLPPSLWSLENLLKFRAYSNSLSGHLPPEIGNLKAATVIDLFDNNFSGSIPQSIDGLQNLVTLYLSQNRLEGPIPESFGKLLSLETLDLSHNKLTGVIPQSLQALVYLKEFNVSFNALSGQIPSNGSFLNFTYQSFMYNNELCGAPRFHVPPCPIISPHKKRKRLHLIMYILIGISSLIVASILVFALMRWKKKNNATFQADPSAAMTHGRISRHELEKATDGFSESNLLGVGSFSFVYKGALSDGILRAIKRFNLESAGALKSFDTECEVLRNLRHRNLTKVITSCSNLEFKALVLEYMPYGSLEKWLHSLNHFLDIFQRLDVMIDVASALDYLHNGYSTPVVHCDVKPSNILLDEDMVGHVCDFGIAKLLGVENGSAQTKTLGTIGYIAPEYGSEGVVSKKCDVYSYGITLMETFTRRRPSDDMFAGEVTLRHWIESSFPSAITQVVDSDLLKPEEKHFDAKVEFVSSVMEQALHCTATSPEARIDMQDVLSALKKIRNQFLRSCGRN